jgi:S1-C subfamily serine protease
MSDVAGQLSKAFSGAVEATDPSILRVEGGRRGSASGFVWSKDGVVVTSSHGLELEDGIELGLSNGQTTRAALVGRDPGTDLAVLRSESTDLTPAHFQGLDGVRIGELVLAVGRPGRGLRASLGIVSALGDGWRTPSGGKIERFLQSDATLERGYSGSLLIGSGGAALGMNTAGLLRGAGVTLPKATLDRVVASILAHGRLRRGWLGVGTYPVRLPSSLGAERGQRTGLIVLAVHEKSPAEQAGFLIGDVLLSLSGQPTSQVGELQALLDEERIGQEVSASILRAGSTREVKVTIGARP